MLKVTFHLTISMCGQRATSKIQWNNYHHRSCGPSLTGKTSSVSLTFTHGTHRNVKNSWVRSSLYSTTFSSFHRICHFNYMPVLYECWSSVVVQLYKAAVSGGIF